MASSFTHFWYGPIRENGIKFDTRNDGLSYRKYLWAVKTFNRESFPLLAVLAISLFGLSLEYRHQYSKMDHEMVFPQTNWPSFRALEFEFANQRYQHYLKRFIVLMPMLYFSICFSWFFKKHDNLIFIAICEQQGPSVWKVLKFSYFVKITPSKQLDWN